MAGGFSINAMLNASKWLRGVKDMESSLDDLEGSLDDVSDEMKKLDKADGFKDLERGAERAEDEASDLEKRLRKVRDEAKDIRKAGDDIGDVGSKGFRKMGDAAEEVSGEFKQNLGETFSSFRGDLEDLPQVAQDVLGGLAGSFGGLTGAIGLAAGAAGIGLLIAAFQGLAEEEEARKERVGEWTAAYIEAMSTMSDAVATFGAVEDIYTDPEKYDKAAQAAKDWGVDVSTAVNAMAGDTTALSIAQESLDEKTRKLNKALETTQVNADGTAQGFADVQAEVSRGADTLSNITGEMAEGAQRAEEYASSLYDLAKSTGTATGEVDDLGNAIITMPDGKKVVIDAKTQKAYQNVDALEQNIQGVRGKTVSVDVNTGGASAGLNHWINQNNGRTIKIYGKYVSPAGSSIP